MKQSVGERIAEDWACGRLTGTVAEAIDEACAKAKAFAAEREAVDRRILIGGNHLASSLLGIADPVGIKDYDEALHKHGQPYADIWVCWRAIMDVRDGETDNRRRGSETGGTI